MKMYHPDGTMTEEGQAFHDTIWPILRELIRHIVNRGCPVHEVCHVLITATISLEAFFSVGMCDI
jgi:hypothetical protein